MSKGVFILFAFEFLENENKFEKYFSMQIPVLRYYTAQPAKNIRLYIGLCKCKK